jgi:hypothetical protein
MGVESLVGLRPLLKDSILSSSSTAGTALLTELRGCTAVTPTSSTNKVAAAQGLAIAATTNWWKSSW